MNMKNKATRVNRNQPTYAILPVNDLAQKQLRRSTKPVPRVRHPDEAMPPAADLFERPIYKGDELKPYDGRQGAMDFKKLPSRGIG